MVDGWELRRRRHDAGLTLQQVARAAGTAEANVSAYERGTKTASRRTLERLVVVIDPMLATGNSAVAAVDRLKERGAGEIRFMCLLAAPEGLARFRDRHADVAIYTAAIDSHLDSHGYVVPGLGDAGDRLYGTR